MSIEGKHNAPQENKKCCGWNFIYIYLLIASFFIFWIDSYTSKKQDQVTYQQKYLQFSNFHTRSHINSHSTFSTDNQSRKKQQILRDHAFKIIPFNVAFCSNFSNSFPSRSWPRTSHSCCICFNTAFSNFGDDENVFAGYRRFFHDEYASFEKILLPNNLHWLFLDACDFLMKKLRFSKVCLPIFSIQA